jgi:hypothetical protein
VRDSVCFTTCFGQPGHLQVIQPRMECVGRKLATWSILYIAVSPKMATMAETCSTHQISGEKNKVYDISVFHCTKQCFLRFTVCIWHILIEWKRVIKAERCYSPVISPTTTKLYNKGTHGQHAKPSQSYDYSQWSTCTQVHNAYAPYCHLWSVRLYYVSPHYLTNSTTFKIQ